MRGGLGEDLRGRGGERIGSGKGRHILLSIMCSGECYKEGHDRQ